MGNAVHGFGLNAAYPMLDLTLLLGFVTEPSAPVSGSG